MICDRSLFPFSKPLEEWQQERRPAEDNAGGSAMLLTPLKRAFHAGKSFVSALFASPGDMHRAPKRPPSAKPKPPSPALAVPYTQPAEMEEPTHIDLTGDTDSEESDHSGAGIESEEESAFDEELNGSMTEAAEQLEEQRKLADQEWIQRLHKATRDRPPDLHFELVLVCTPLTFPVTQPHCPPQRRAREREAFLGAQWAYERSPNQHDSFRDRSVSQSPSSTPIIDYFIEKSFQRSPSTDLSTFPGRTADPDYTYPTYENEQDTEEGIFHSPPFSSGLGHLECGSSPSYISGCQLTVGKLNRLYLAQSIAKFDSRKRVYQLNETHRYTLGLSHLFERHNLI